MTTAVTTQHRANPTAMIAAAAAAVIVGGAAAVGFAISQDGSPAPTRPARAPDACQVNACMPHHGSGSSEFVPDWGDYGVPH